ncbi:glycerol-3-phosphate acyltransferase [Bacillus massilinigeriensis]|uniref:glycerol-3-phosphate acyltransferase n=1 Tax=Bacillus mediterraneensis TaxID=1805474 RepID=UPI00190EB6AC|nr:glycerol-3-phosphate acyltransferase [Bacillus mediterraneensis]
MAGNLMVAWFVGKRKGINLQEHESGNLGARNAGRVLGKKAFLLVFLGDGLKGAIAVALGRAIGLEEWVVASGAVFAILGHLYPFWLKFRGGLGIATFIGAGIALDPILFLGMVLGTAIGLPLLRSLTLSMLAGYAFYLGGFVLSGKAVLYSPMMVAIILILWEHRDNLRKAWILKRKK